MKLLFVFTVALAAVNSASLNLFDNPEFPEGRIINGRRAAKGEAPYIVSLQTNFHFCAGSIIDEHWVLTAANCLIHSTFQVIAGLHVYNELSDVQIREVRRRFYIFIHEKYDFDVSPYDIGLIYLTEPFNLNALARDGSAPVAKINLPSGKYNQTGKGKFYGWGLTSIGYYPGTLQTLNVDIIDYEQCKAVLAHPDSLYPTNICTYTPNTADGGCNEDMGGPLIRNTTDGPELVGIASWFISPCVEKSYPTVFTNTSAHLNWIQQTIKNFKPNEV